MRSARLFFGSAAGIALAFAALVPVLFPFGLIGGYTPADRERVWLLCVFCTGVMMALFGISARLGGFSFITTRAVVESGGVQNVLAQRAADERKQAREDTGGFRGDFATWVIVTGVFLLCIYFALWAYLR